MPEQITPRQIIRRPARIVPQVLARCVAGTPRALGSGLASHTDPIPGRKKQFSRVLARNIEGLLTIRRAEQQRRSAQERISDAITHFTGSLRFVYIHAALFGGWVLWNLGWIPGAKPFDSSFVVLAMVASVEAIFLSTFVLISQNRMQVMADKRAELDLQVSLLAEHEVTQLMTLLDRVAQQLGIDTSDPSIEEVEQDVDPRAVLHTIEETQSRVDRR